MDRQRKISYVEYVKQCVLGKKVCICPMGVGGIALAEEMIRRGINVDYFCDSNKAGSRYVCGGGAIACISFEKLKAYIEQEEKIIVILETTKYYDELKNRVQACGCNDILRLHCLRFYTDDYAEKINEQDVVGVCNLLEDDVSKRIVRHICKSWQMLSIPENYFEEIKSPISEIYFDREIKGLDVFDKDISFVDCGAYIGDTVIGAIEKMIKIRQAFMFELDKSIYEQCYENVKDLVKKGVDIKLYPYGVSDSHRTVKITTGDGNSRLLDMGGEVTSEVFALDDILMEDTINYIKMDVEGEELRALKGAEKILKTKRPLLAICLYHKPEDMFTIPKYIKSIDPSYKLFVRHYSATLFDTVLYAV